MDAKCQGAKTEDSRAPGLVVEMLVRGLDGECLSLNLGSALHPSHLQLCALESRR